RRARRTSTRAVVAVSAHLRASRAHAALAPSSAHTPRASHSAIDAERSDARRATSRCNSRSPSDATSRCSSASSAAATDPHSDSTSGAAIVDLRSHEDVKGAALRAAGLPASGSAASYTSSVTSHNLFAENRVGKNAGVPPDQPPKLGLITPVLTLNPRVHNAWEQTAGFDAVVAAAEAADRLGYHHLTCSEHVAVPAGEVAARRGSRYYDPLATFGYLAARTT